jgi:hypothetical protein
MKIYNCPDCQRTDSCFGCSRTLYVPSNKPEQESPYHLDTAITIDVPEASKNCSNHPINGGTGICHCSLGLPQITC